MAHESEHGCKAIPPSRPRTCLPLLPAAVLLCAQLSHYCNTRRDSPVCTTGPMLLPRMLLFSCVHLCAQLSQCYSHARCYSPVCTAKPMLQPRMLRTPILVASQPCPRTKAFATGTCLPVHSTKRLPSRALPTPPPTAPHALPALVVLKVRVSTGCTLASHPGPWTPSPWPLDPESSALSPSPIRHSPRSACPRLPRPHTLTLRRPAAGQGLTGAAARDRAGAP